MRKRILLSFTVLSLARSATAQTRIAELGRCQLELGGVIEGCRVGYRTFGTLAPDRRNAILIPTWFASRAERWVPLLGPNGMVDTTGFYVMVVEALGAGESSSPVNSVSQKGAAFPELTIGDMVEAEYRLAHDKLGLPELHAVVGISLGGLQSFEWGVRHGDYVRRIVPITGAPRQGIFGHAVWELISDAADDGARGIVPRDSALLTLSRLLVVAGTSPAAENRRDPKTYAEYVTRQANDLRSINLSEWALHARAILRHDVARRFGGDINAAARQWRPATLVVSARHDHSVDAEPALEFARLIHADTLVLDSPAGHSAVFGDSTTKRVVRDFLKKPR